MPKSKPILKPSQVLQRVKKMLPKGYTTHAEDNSPYICDNIQQLCRKGYMTAETETTLKAHIRCLLNDNFCLKDWLLRTGKASAEEFRQDYDNSWRKLQVTRQLWLDDMIVHFKSKGM
jgi:hypothetical protein